MASDTEGTQSLQIKSKVRNGQGWIRFLEIEVPPEEVNSKFKSTFEEYRSKAKIPGFRPGKAPLGLVRQRYENQVKGDVLEDLMEDAYQQALEHEKLLPLDNPRISDVEFDETRPLRFKAEIEIRPEIKLGKYKGFRIEKRIGKVTEKDVDESLQYLRERMAEYHPVQRPSENGDLVVVDLIKKHDKLGRLKEEKLENVEIYLGGEGILDEFQRNLMGVRLGEMKNILVKYPDDYFERNLAGDEILFLAVTKEIKKKVLPELNDDFASRASKSKTLPELKEALRKNLEAQNRSDATRALSSEIMKRVVEANLFHVPISLLNRYLDSVIEDFKEREEKVDENKVRSQYRPLGENFIRWSYLYHEIAHAEGIKVETEDRKEWVEGFARRYNLTEEKAREILGKSRRVRDIDESILEDKVIEFITENSEIITAE